MSTDELAEIDGHKPKVVLEDGEERQVGSQSSNSTYKVKRTWDHYFCSCPAWRNQGGAPVNARTCKHLKSLLGDAYELARIKMKNPDGPPPKGTAKAAKAKPAPKAKPAAKPVAKAPAKRKRGKADDDEEEEEEEEEEDPKPAKRGRKAPVSKSKPKSKVKAEELDEEDVEEEEGEDDEEATDEKPGKVIPELLLANKYELDGSLDPTGWWISEKLDGVRAFFDGTQFISRLGNPFAAPVWFIEKLPNDVTLDGELYCGRGEFQSTVSIVKTVNSPHWKNVSFQIFDVPSRGNEEFEARYDFLQKTFGENGTHTEDQIIVVKQELAKDKDHVLSKLKEVEALGGEGIMLRKPGSAYEGKRSGSLLKLKSFYDAEAVVVGHASGKGRNAGVTGALQCKMASGKTFSVGSGLSDKLRKNPPKVGTIIVYRFQELTKDRVPRFPTFVGVAADKTEPKDADVPLISKV